MKSDNYLFVYSPFLNCAGLYGSIYAKGGLSALGGDLLILLLLLIDWE